MWTPSGPRPTVTLRPLNLHSSHRAPSFARRAHRRRDSTLANSTLTSHQPCTTLPPRCSPCFLRSLPHHRFAAAQLPASHGITVQYSKQPHGLAETHDATPATLSATETFSPFRAALTQRSFPGGRRRVLFGSGGKQDLRELPHEYHHPQLCLRPLGDRMV